jgi:hypothetical protein
MRATGSTRIWAWITAGGIGLGSVLPWASVTIFLGTIDVNGTSGDGKLTLVAAIVAVIGAALANRWLFAVPCFVAAAIMGYDAINITNVGDDYSDVASVDIGFGLIIGLAAAIGGSVLGLIWPREPARSVHQDRPWQYATPAGWYPDGAALRYWDGVRWTEHVAPHPAPGAERAWQPPPQQH